MLVGNTSNVMVMSTIRDDLRGRVMSIYSLIFFGAMPIGSLLTGLMAARYGEVLTVAGSGAILLGFSILVYARTPQVRKMF